MKKYLSSAELKCKARNQLSGNMGTVIGAFLMHIACVLPLSYSAAFLSLDSFYKIVIYLGINIVIGFVGCLFITGENYIALSIACKQDTGVMDVFYAFRGQAGKCCLVYGIPVVINVLAKLPLNLVIIALESHLPKQEEMIRILSTNDYDTVLALYDELMPLYTLEFCAALLYIVAMLIVTVIFSQTLFVILDYPDLGAGESIRKSIRLMKGSFGRYIYLMFSFIPWQLLRIITFNISALWSEPYIRMTYANFYLELAKNADTSNKQTAL